MLLPARTRRHTRPGLLNLRFTIYDLRFTIYDLENSASGAREAAKQMRTGCNEAVIGRGYKATVAADATRWQTEPAHLRFTRYEVRFGKFARVARRQVVCLAFHTRRNGLNEPGEDFIGTRVMWIHSVFVNHND